MRLQKTDRARAELKPGVRTLGQRERTLLLLADGSKTVSDFRPLFAGDGEQIALQLLKDGFLEAHPASDKNTSFVPSWPAPLAVEAPREEFPTPETTHAIQVSADSFEGKRSLATTRMFCSTGVNTCLPVATRPRPKPSAKACATPRTVSRC